MTDDDEFQHKATLLVIRDALMRGITTTTGSAWGVLKKWAKDSGIKGRRGRPTLPDDEHKDARMAARILKDGNADKPISELERIYRVGHGTAQRSKKRTKK